MDLNVTVDKFFGSALSGSLLFSYPQPSWFLRLFGNNYAEKKAKVVLTDYTSFATLWRCNDDSWLYSFDEYTILNRPNANIANIYNSFTLNGALNLTTFAKANQSNPLCSTISF